MTMLKTEYITLQQFLKLLGIASTGGQAKIMAQEASIQVNGVPENRRGRKLYPGDIVVVDGKKFVVG